MKYLGVSTNKGKDTAAVDLSVRLFLSLWDDRQSSQICSFWHLSSDNLPHQTHPGLLHAITQRAERTYAYTPVCDDIGRTSPTCPLVLYITCIGQGSLHKRWAVNAGLPHVINALNTRRRDT